MTRSPLLTLLLTAAPALASAQATCLVTGRLDSDAPASSTLERAVIQQAAAEWTALRRRRLGWTGYVGVSVNPLVSGLVIGGVFDPTRLASPFPLGSATIPYQAFEEASAATPVGMPRSIHWSWTRHTPSSWPAEGAPS